MTKKDNSNSIDCINELKKEYDKKFNSIDKKITKIVDKVKELENNFKKNINVKKIHCIQPFCNSTNVEFIGFEENEFHFITTNKKYKCRDCGYEWVEKSK